MCFYFINVFEGAEVFEFGEMLSTSFCHLCILFLKKACVAKSYCTCSFYYCITSEHQLSHLKQYPLINS